MLHKFEKYIYQIINFLTWKVKKKKNIDILNCIKLEWVDLTPVVETSIEFSISSFNKSDYKPWQYIF